MNKKLSKYAEMVKNQHNNYYYSEREGALMLKRGLVSKVGGIVLGGSDYIISGFISQEFPALGTGFTIRGRLCDASNTYFNEILRLVKDGIIYGDSQKEKISMRNARKDLTALKLTEQELYKSGFVPGGQKAILNVF